MKELPKLFRTTWDEIHALEAQKKAILADISNHLYIDFETFFSEDYSLTKKDMTYLKFIKHRFFKIQSAAVRIGNGKTHYFREAGEIRDYIEEALIENPDLVLVAQQAFFDGGIVRYHFGLEFKYCIDLPSLSRAVWPNAMFHNLNAIGERLYPGDKSKQKSDDIAFTKGVYNWTDLIHERNERYNIQDTDLLAEFVQYFVNGGFPHDVLLQQSIVNMMYFKPSFHADVPLLTKARNDAEKRQEEAVQAAIKFLQENARVNKHFWVTMADRDKTKYPTQKAYNEIYRRTFGMPPMKDKAELRKVLTSNDKFAYLLEKGFDIPVPLKQGSSKIDPDAMTYALGKNDVEFQAMMTAHRDLAVVWTGRMESKSNQEKTRATTFLEYADLCDGFIPVPLRNSAAHTHRLGGTESINMQNLGRKSPCRPALTGGGVYAINATDSSNIESRVSAWFCGHEEKLDLFRRGGDPYNETATVIFGYPVDRKSKTVDHSMQGAVGKATDLGCFAKGTAVVTDAGIMPIEQVRTCNKVWNGVEWVSHKGAVYKGMKDVINIGNSGIYATPEHLIWVDEYPKQAFTATEREVQIAAQRERTKFRHIDSDFQRMYPEKWEQIVANAVFWMQGAEMEAELPVGLMPELSSFREELGRRTKSMGRALRLNEAAMQQSIGHELPELRRTWNSIELQIEEALHRIRDGDLRETTTKDASGQDTKRWTLRAGKLTACIERREQSEQTHKYVYVLQWDAGTEEACIPCGTDAVSRDTLGGENDTTTGDERQEESSRNTRVLLWPSDLHKKQTYDIADCEKGNRFALSNGLIVKNCGYQMGADRFRDYLNAGPLGMDPIFLEDIPELAKYPNPYKYVIDKYRRANYPIKDMWDTLQSTIFDMARKSCDYELGPLLIRHERIWLPSGLSLHYPGLHKTKEGNWAYESRDGGLSFLFGGKLLENIIQALSQIIILRQMVWISCYLELVYGDEARTALQVHDEVVSAFPLEGAELTGYTDRGEPIWKNGEKIEEVSADITAIMHRTDSWFDGIPIGAEGETHLQYS